MQKHTIFSHPKTFQSIFALVVAFCLQNAYAGIADTLEQLIGKQAPNRIAVVLVDTTGSIANADWTLYDRSFQELLKSNLAGDRVVLATISDQPVTKFIAASDHTIERKDIHLIDEAVLTRTNKALSQDFQQTRSQTSKPAKATFILDTITAVDQIFAQARAKNLQMTLLILSDMIEESPSANFARKTPNEITIKKVIDGRHSQSLLPDLTNVQVYIVGAGGKSGEQMAHIHKFWDAYFSAAGASVQDYGRNPPEFIR